MRNDENTDRFADEVSKNLNSRLENGDYEYYTNKEPLENRREEYEPQYEPEFEPQYIPDYGRNRQQRPPKRHVFRTILIVIIALAVLLAAAVLLFSKQPIRETDGLGNRRKGVSTVLIVGTDDEGYRTDTIILASVDAAEHTVSLLSIPRDTYVYTDYSVPKINSACGWAGGGKDGMEELMAQVKNVIGFMPDGYIMINLNAFIEIVDVMGGVEYDVPVDMYYDDPAQDLHIALDAGMQKLDGQQAMGLVRFRSGYAMADLERVNVQRDFVKSAMSQWLKPSIVLKAPKLLSILKQETTTDLSTANIVWLAKAVLGCKTSEMSQQTLPGVPDYINGGSYFVADEDEIYALMREDYSPYR